MPPKRAATIEIATPVARRCVGNTSVIRQSNEALPQAIIPVKIAETIKFCCLFVTKYMPAEHRPAVKVLKIRKNFRPNRSIPSIATTNKNQIENYFAVGKVNIAMVIMSALTVFFINALMNFV